eukprot:CAMPEP_0118990478 /NCGR_PEP_ID=MMETSP1173-20130426/49995_1 /TAXON_ID=1034831 /ORGANISM="Rhizochromulina marina cf, Strain CCMP1243" /LENGTH=51 /DNA_ID=CAMNT_0006941535 /DNA_START=75 /DNA_END=227 /DNA_ORIENTATION=-
MAADKALARGFVQEAAEMLLDGDVKASVSTLLALAERCKQHDGLDGHAKEL